MLPTMRRWRLSVLAILVSIAGCSTHAPPPPPAPSAPLQAGAEGGGSRQLPPAERLLVRRAELELTASEPDSIAPRATEITRAAGGYVASSVVEEGRRLRMSLRVPSSALEPALTALSALVRWRGGRSPRST